MTAPVQDLCVTNLGMVSSLGRDVITSCAAARAGLSSARELLVMDDAVFGLEEDDSAAAVSGHVARGVADGFTGVGKALTLGAAALLDLLQRRQLTERESVRAAMYLNLSDHAVEDAHHAALRARADGDDDEEGAPPEIPSEAWKRRTAGLLPRLLEAVGLSLDPGHQHLLHGGRAGVVSALQSAMRSLRTGAVDRCIVGGIDSRVEPRFLRAAAALGVLRTNESPTGLIPGEAAAFFMIERAQHVGLRTPGATPVLVTGAAISEEPGGSLGDRPPTGGALSAVIAGLLAQPDVRQTASFVVSDLDGTERAALDWAHTLVRLRREHAFGDMPVWCPATSFGDTGAAAGAVAACLAARAFERGYAPGPGALVCLSSESGARGAFGLHAQRA